VIVDAGSMRVRFATTPNFGSAIRSLKQMLSASQLLHPGIVTTINADLLEFFRV
jgi:hypothetical protein